MILSSLLYLLELKASSKFNNNNNNNNTFYSDENSIILYMCLILLRKAVTYGKFMSQQDGCTRVKYII